jgi:DNA topoisomerase-1
VASSDEPAAAAGAAGLRYVNDLEEGIRRVRSGRGFVYRTADGARVRDAAVLARIRSLAIPPAWRDVRICPVAHGHIQAIGRDQKGRKQYRYHPRWRQVRDEAKYERMLEFARALPRLRARIERDLALPGLPREKVLATVVRLLETTLIRVGNEEYARHNRSYGLTTMRDQHVDVAGARLRFHFRGKSGKRHDVGIEDRRLARIVKRCQDLPGEELFQYVDEKGERHAVLSNDVNDYLHSIAGREFTAKDFRTWAGTVLAAWALAELRAGRTQKQARANVVRAIERVAGRLGNTAAICRKCYVHPAVVESYLDGTLVENLADKARGALHERSWSHDEAAVLSFLARRLSREVRHRSALAARRAKAAGPAPAAARLGRKGRRSAPRR